MNDRQPTDNSSPKPSFNRDRSFDKNPRDPLRRRNPNSARDGQFFKRDNRDNRDTRPTGNNRDMRDKRDSRDNQDNRTNSDNRDNRFRGRNDQNRNDRGGFNGGAGRFSRDNDNRFPPKDRRFAGKNKFPPKGKIQKPWKKEFLPRLVSDMQITDGKHRRQISESFTFTEG